MPEGEEREGGSRPGKSGVALGDFRVDMLLRSCDPKARIRQRLALKYQLQPQSGLRPPLSLPLIFPAMQHGAF